MIYSSSKWCLAVPRARLGAKSSFCAKSQNCEKCSIMTSGGGYDWHSGEGAALAVILPSFAGGGPVALGTLGSSGAPACIGIDEWGRREGGGSGLTTDEKRGVFFWCFWARHSSWIWERSSCGDIVWKHSKRSDFPCLILLPRSVVFEATKLGTSLGMWCPRSSKV